MDYPTDFKIRKDPSKEDCGVSTKFKVTLPKDRNQWSGQATKAFWWTVKEINKWNHIYGYPKNDYVLWVAEESVREVWGT